MNPELMVIGDSLPQGCRSLSVAANYCAQSWPARLAAAQGWEFVTPDFPRPVLYDLEAEINEHLGLKALITSHSLSGFIDRFRSNLADWLRNDRESAATCFDNLAVAGDLVFDLYKQTAARSQATIEEVTAGGISLVDLPRIFKRIADLHIAINARFTLNPSQDPASAGFTQLDWVRARLPKRLIVEIGHNHGLYAVGSSASVPEEGVTKTDPIEGAYFAQWAELARQLAVLPADIEMIVVCLLPKVGAVANLRPKGGERVDGYALAYEPVFSVAPNTLTGSDLAAVDQSIRDANNRIRETVLNAAQTVGTAGRVKFVDVFELFERFDFKNSRDALRRVPISGRPTIDNLYLDRTLSLHGLRLVAGGFESADGMHASGAGYALLASEIMTGLGFDHDREALLGAAFDDDRLLSHPSLNLDAVAGVLGLIRRTQIDLGPSVAEAVATDRAHVGRVVTLMQSIFDR